MHAPVQLSEIAFFTECYRPIINGVVASIDGLRAGLAEANVDVTVVAPHFPHEGDDDRAVVRLPSLPLPTSTGYRLCIPYLSRATRARVGSASIVHVHSPFVTGWLGANIARRSGVPLVFTYHTRIDEYAHYAPFDPQIARAYRDHLRNALRNPSHLQPGDMRQCDSHAIVSAEALDLGARTVRSGNDRDAAVGENTVDVEKENFNAARSLGKCWLNHSLMIQAIKRQAETMKKRQAETVKMNNGEWGRHSPLSRSLPSEG